MQSYNVNVLTKSLKLKRLNVKLQNSQNSNKLLMFFVKSQRRKHRDSEIIHVILIQTTKSIDSINFLAKVMRKLFVYIMYSMNDQINQKHFSKIERICQRMKTLIEILLLNSFWTVWNNSQTESQLLHVSNDF